MRELCIPLRVALAILLVFSHNTAAETDCHLPEDSEIVFLINITYTSAVTVNLMRTQYACLASGTHRDQYRSASLLVGYACTTPTCVRGAEVGKELLDLSCVDGAWSVAAFTEDPDAEFDIEARTDCSSCISSTDSNVLSYDARSHCVGKHTYTYYLVFMMLGRAVKGFGISSS